MYSRIMLSQSSYSDLRQVVGFLPGTLVFSTNKTDRHDIAKILLKVALNTMTPNRSRQCISGNPDNFTVSISFEYELERLVAVFELYGTNFCKSFYKWVKFIFLQSCNARKQLRLRVRGHGVFKL
jgi:hypothetical protein